MDCISHGGENVRFFALILCLVSLAAGVARAESPPINRYLVDGRVHVAVIYRTDRTGGEISWTDTVTGRAGEAPFRLRNGVLWVETTPGVSTRAHHLPALAVIFEGPPWAVNQPRRALGVSLD
jgi:hypothetical protein